MKQMNLALLALLTAASVPAIAAPKTDILIFGNGDHLTGEVKSLERGKLRFNTNATGTISIEWDDVASLTSKQNIQVETDSGNRYLGRLSATSEEMQVVIETHSGPVTLDIARVVLMVPIEAQGLDRLDGDITVGYNFAKASSVEQFQLGFDMAVRTETRIYSLKADTVMSDSKGSEASQRQSLGFNYTRLHPNRWLTGAVVTLTSNDELELDLRTSVGVGGGRILHRTNSAGLTLTGGLQVSRELLADNTSNEDTIEAYGALNWDWFRYDSPVLDLSMNLQVYPNLTNTGRVRSELDVTFKWELIEDLFWQLQLYQSRDSDPVVQDATKTDYGINSSLGYSF